MLVTGIQAAGKSTVGRILAERFERGAFVEGDLMWKLIVSGRVDMTPDLDPGSHTAASTPGAETEQCS